MLKYAMHLVVDEKLVRRLVAGQFPQWAALLVWPVAVGGWDNRTFHLGEHMIVRLPSAAESARKIATRLAWIALIGFGIKRATNNR